MNVKIEIRQAAQLWRAGEKDASLQRFRLLTRQFPEEITPWLAVARISPNEAERNAAIARALALDPGSQAAWQLQSRLLAAEEAARNSARPEKQGTGKTAVIPRENSAAAHLQQAASARQQGHPENALEMFWNIVQRLPDNKTAWWGVYTSTPDPVQKTEALTQLLRLDPDNQRIRSFHLKRLSAATAIAADKRSIQASAKRPVKLIIFAWVMTISMFVPFAGLLTGFISLFCAGMLLRDKNQTARKHGWIILAVWLVLFVVGFVIGFTAAL